VQVQKLDTEACFESTSEVCKIVFP
jgi:hypothetical protein